MADSGEKIDGLIIPVVVEADEKSPGIALHKLTKDFLKELKKGYIEVPASLDFGEANTKELTDKLKEVQTDFAKKWKAMAKEGFFADSDFITKKQKRQLDDFIDSFKKLAKLTDSKRANKRSGNTWLRTNESTEKRGRGSLAYLNDQISKYERKVQDYNIKRSNAIAKQQVKQSKQVEKETKEEINHTKKVIKSNKTNRAKLKRNRKPYISTGGITKDEVEHAKELADKTYYNQTGITKDIKQKYNSTEQNLTTKVWKNGINSKRSLKLSNYGGPHGSRYAQSQAREAMKFWGPNRDSLIKYINREMAQNAGTGQFNKSALKDKELAQLKNIALVGGQLNGKTPDVTVADLATEIADTITNKLAATDFQNIQKDFTNSLHAITGFLMNRFKDGGYIGINYGEEGTYKGVGINYERWQAAVKQVTDGLANIDLTALQQVFDSTRSKLTKTIKDITIQQHNLTNSIKDMEKKIADNKLIIGQETYSREKVTAKLNESKNAIEVAKKKLKTLRSTRTKTTNELESYRADYQNAENVHKKPYYAASNAYNELIKNSKDYSSMTKEEKEAYDAKKSELQKEMEAHPYLDLTKNYNNTYDKLLELKQPIEDLEQQILREKKRIEAYTATIEKIDTETESEKNARLEHIKLLKQENEQLKQDIKSLEELKQSLKTDENSARKELYDGKNYTSIRDLITANLLPLITRSLVVSDKTGQVNNSQLTAIQNTEKTGENIADIADADANSGSNTKEFADRETTNTAKTNKILDQEINSSLKKLAALINDKGNESGNGSCEQILNEISQNITKILTVITSTGVKTTSKLKDNNTNKNKQASSLVPFTKKNWIYPYQFGKDVYGNKVVHGGQEYPTKAAERAYPDFRPTVNFGISEIEEIKKYSHAVFKRISDNLSDSINNAINTHAETMQTNSSVDVSRSNIYASLKDPAKWSVKLANAFEDLFNISVKYKKVISATSNEQDKIAAERIHTYGMDKGRNITGDKILFARNMSLWRNKDKFKELFKDLKISKGVDIDTTKVTEQLGKLLTGKSWRNAQMGGSPLRNLIGYGTGFIGMPSLEKSRATAEALNQINANIREKLNTVLIDIQDKESALAGMKESGDLKLGEKGEVLEDSTTEAKALAAQLENSKLMLDTILADMGEVNGVIKKSHGNINKVMKKLSFASPMLRENNAIVHNIAAGYDKSGKALKFQSRTAEILNYTFQLMGRHIGQILKSWAFMIHPINLLKRAFSDFMGYNVKWQRTMNVIKYNLRAIVRPFMDKIAQILVNIIGFLDIISQKIQAAFGHTPISLFDQAAADSEKIHEELEAAANVSADFDELHDIGSDNSGANDLLGEIYKPQLSQDWIDLANQIGDTFAHLIKGDMGFGDVCKEILRLLGELLGKIAKVIWDWFKETALGKWITEHWKSLLATLLTIFLAWKLLKIAGKLIWKALTSNLTGEAFGSVLGKLGVKFMDIFTATQFGSDFVRGIKAMFTSGGMIGTFKAGGASLGAIFAQSLVAAIGVAIAGFSIAKGFDIVADDESYNLGYEAYGGTKDKDKKSGAGGKALGTLGGAAGGALAGLAIGGPIGAAIGAAIGGIAGLITTSLAPAFEKLEVAARDANNEMQKIEYYEGAVKGAQSQVDIFDEQQQLLKQSLELSTQAVYDQGEKLGISKSRMDELVQATKDGTFTTDILTGSETGLAGSLTDLAQKQEHTTEVTKKLEEAQKKLLKAQTELSIAQDIEAGNFEIAAARIEVAEAQGVYSTEDATKKRIQLYKQGGEEERKELLQDLTPEQRKRMLEYEGVTEKELAELARLWNQSGTDTQNALLKGVDDQTISKFKGQMNKINEEIKSHQSFWQGVGDTLAEIFTFGNATTWTYNGEAKYYKDQNKVKIQKNALGTNYVEADGLQYLHQGEAIIPKKYNQPYQPGGMSAEERAYMDRMIVTMNKLDGTISQGINIRGEFRQRGNDLVATVEKARNRNGNQPLNNAAFAR